MPYFWIPTSYSFHSTAFSSGFLRQGTERNYFLVQGCVWNVFILLLQSSIIWLYIDSRLKLNSFAASSVHVAVISPKQISLLQISSVQSLSCVQLFATPWITALQASLSSINSWSPPKPMSIESVMPSNHLILCFPLLLLPLIFLNIKVFSNESTLRIRWPKYWSFSFSTSPSNQHPRLVSFRMDWLDLVAAQGTLKSLIQHHSSKASVLRCSAFFTVQLSHPYMTTGKTIALTRRTFVDKVYPIW